MDVIVINKLWVVNFHVIDHEWCKNDESLQQMVIPEAREDYKNEPQSHEIDGGSPRPLAGPSQLSSKNESPCNDDALAERKSDEKQHEWESQAGSRDLELFVQVMIVVEGLQ